MSSSDHKPESQLESKPQKDEIENLRSILRGAHKPNVSFANGLIRGVKDRLQARFQRQVIVERLEKPKDEDAA